MTSSFYQIYPNEGQLLFNYQYSGIKDALLKLNICAVFVSHVANTDLCDPRAHSSEFESRQGL